MTEQRAVTETRLRAGVLVVAAVGAAGTGLELALARHWKSPVQLVPWVALAIVGAGIAIVAARPSPGAIRAARVTAGAAIIAGAIGVFKHVEGNYDAAPLDAVYGPKWDTMSEASRWWHALIESVGPSPSFAPGALALIAALLLLATYRHPAVVRATS